MPKEGLYEEVISEKLDEKLNELKNMQHEREKIDKEEAKNILSKYIGQVTKRALSYIREDKKSKDSEGLLEQIKACNEIIDILSEISNEESLKDYNISEKAQVLTSLYSKINHVRSINKKVKVIRPTTSISESTLFTGSSLEPSMISELKKEILSCDCVDMLVSFIKWSGLRMIIDELREFTKNGDKRIRIITTSYMGATDYKAVLELSKIPNIDIKVSYDTKRTRLHAKAYMFKRETGFTTAYIGSSNLSNSAMTSGLEWNIKVTEKDSFDIVRKFQATFESYWNDSEFVIFDGDDNRDKNRLKDALKSDNKNKLDFNFNLDIRPYPYQKQILEKLRAEREIFERNKNLLVAATGVGKTVISAFDYKGFVKTNPKRVNRLLFVAHREEILRQSRDTFRAILKDGNFGDLFVGTHKPESLDHLFISIQSFNSSKLYEKLTTDYYDFIIVDEVHHGPATSYQRLLEYFEPKVLLGLTATPERMDGKSVLKYFDDRIAEEIRLTEAIDRKQLSPFQYFCVTDEVDLSKLKWGRNGYDKKELSNVYTNSDLRANKIINSIDKYVKDIDEVKGLGFCVTVEHAKFMADIFNKNDIPSISLHGNSSTEERESAKGELQKGEIKFIFVVDLYNEGVDIPSVNTVLFLRPTESLTVFLQQLGRGLRIDDDKECLTVLDFIGQANRNYNFEEKFRALMGKTRHSVKYCIENDFINLPKGCYIKLEKQAKEYVLRNIKTLRNTKRNIISKMKTFTADTGMKLNVENFLKYHHLSLIDLYGKNGNRSFYKMMVEAKLKDNFYNKDEEILLKRLKNLFHLDSRRFIKLIIDILNNIQRIDEMYFTLEEENMLNMLYYTFYLNKPEKEGFKSLKEGLKILGKNNELKEEIIEILNYKYNRIDFIDKRVNLGVFTPLDLHCTYNRDQILAGLGYYNSNQKPSFRERVKYLKDKNIDAFFITLNKSDKDFSPSTLYDDYAISEKLFHWQSQSRTSVESPTGQRYINHKQRGSKIILFVREYKKKNGITSPYTYLGTAEYVKHYGNRPISFVWRLHDELPPNMIKIANKSVL
ncbi:MAG: DUF3427 domain-containing protein [Firmicutes bacterium]|nr:DUF3427 domain-containing protein [Bacillota bacterium]